MTTHETRGLLIRFAAYRAIVKRDWNTDDSAWRKVSPALIMPVPANTRPDDLGALAHAAILLGDEKVAAHWARIAFHKAERMRRIHARAWRSYRKLESRKAGRTTK
jgi:hypothetical protein